MGNRDAILQKYLDDVDSMLNSSKSMLEEVASQSPGVEYDEAIECISVALEWLSAANKGNKPETGE